MGCRSGLRKEETSRSPEGSGNGDDTTVVVGMTCGIRHVHVRNVHRAFGDHHRATLAPARNVGAVIECPAVPLLRAHEDVLPVELEQRSGRK